MALPYPPALPTLRRARSPVAVWLGLSLALHAWLISITGTGGGPRETAVPGARLTVLIDPAPHRVADAIALPAPIAPSAAPREARPAPPAAPGLTHPTSAGQTADGALPRADDKTYYSLQQVDVFPAPVSPLRAVALDNGAAAGRIRVLVSIDEAGVVSDAALIEGGSQSVEAALRAVLLPARFTPALKNGRAMKSRVVLSVE